MTKTTTNTPNTDQISSSTEELQAMLDRAPSKEVPKTNGEKHYDLMIGATTYFTTLGASLAGSFFLTRTAWGKENVLQPFQKTIGKQFAKYPSLGGTDPMGRANEVGQIAALMAGGTIPVAPFKWIEEGRIDRINAYNQKHGTGIKDPELEALAQERIDSLPVQSWGSTLAGRATAMGATLALGIPAITATPIKALQKDGGRLLDEYINIGGKIRPKDLIQAQGINDDIVTDATWTALTSTVLLIGSRVAGAVFGEREEEKGQPKIPPIPLIAQPEHLGNVAQSQEVEAQR